VLEKHNKNGKRVRLMFQDEAGFGLIMCQTDDYPHAIRAAQAKPSRLYDSFTKKYGLINVVLIRILFHIQSEAFCNNPIQ
jgi:hypothetical protein